MSKKRVVVIGGGTGTHTVLKGLKNYQAELRLSAIVSMADSGGSTGRLRDEFGHLPAGDVRNALVALANDEGEYRELMRQLFVYRFEKGDGLAGHNFGNLLLTVLTDILGTQALAIKAASQILRVAGEVIPVTTSQTHLRAVYENNEVVVGEHEIDEGANFELHSSRINELSLIPKVDLNPEAKRALEEADLIVLGPGDLYTSVLANLVVDGMKEALINTKAPIVYVCNLMSKSGQTVGMNSKEHLEEIIKYCGRAPSFMLVNNESLPQDLLIKYELEGDHPIINNGSSDEVEILTLPLLAKEEVVTAKGDVLRRSLIRHDGNALARALLQFL